MTTKIAPPIPFAELTMRVLSRQDPHLLLSCRTNPSERACAQDGDAPTSTVAVEGTRPLNKHQAGGGGQAQATETGPSQVSSPRTPSAQGRAQPPGEHYGQLTLR